MDYIIKKIDNKEYKIPMPEIQKLMKYGMTKEESIHTWLCDNDIIVDEEEQALTQKAKGVRLPNAKAETKRNSSKPKTVKVSDEKKELFSTIVEGLKDYEFTIEKENKLIIVKKNDLIFKIDLIETRRKE